jgi:hypothetical protein
MVVFPIRIEYPDLIAVDALQRRGAREGQPGAFRSAALVSISTAVRLAGHRWRLGRNGIATDRR